MVSRRMMIGGGAGAALLAAFGYRAWDRGAFTPGQGPAYEAWQHPQGAIGSYPSLRPVHAAILAASAHNTQPWLFEPHEDSLTVYADLARNLGAADPFRRELYVSIGCAVANALLANDLAAPLEIFDSRLTADLPQSPAKAFSLTIGRKISFAADRFPTAELRAAIPLRHTNRGAYLPDHSIAPKDANHLSLPGNPYASIVFVKDPGAKRELGALIVEATERFITDKAMSDDSGHWVRTGRRDIESHRDGVTVDTAGLSSALTAVAKLLPDMSAANADKYWLSSTRDVQVPTAERFGVIFVRDRLLAREAMLAGMAWQELHLTATVLGLAAQPLNQPVEMMDRDDLLGRKNDYAKDIRKLTGMPGGDPAFLFRIGYAEHPALPSPRRRLQDVIRQKGWA